MPRLLDLFCGRWGWSRAFAARGWECVGVDIAEPSEIPEGAWFIKRDVFSLFVHPGENCRGEIRYRNGSVILDIRPDFIVASSPCEQFSVHGMKHFHPNPPYPAAGVTLFNHTRHVCEASGVPYVMENVRSAQKFVGPAWAHCGPFYLWGNAVPSLLPQGITKGFDHAQKRSASERKKSHPEIIPPELANCVADYAERLLEQRKVKELEGTRTQDD